jgi:hypothetical protein
LFDCRRGGVHQATPFHFHNVLVFESGEHHFAVLVKVAAKFDAVAIFAVAAIGEASGQTTRSISSPPTAPNLLAHS